VFYYLVGLKTGLNMLVLGGKGLNKQGFLSYLWKLWKKVHNYP